MSKMKIHYNNSYDGASCGSYVPDRFITKNVNRVTCSLCRRNGIYLSNGGTRATPKPKVVKPKPEPAFEVTEEVKNALRVIGKISAVYAVRANVCGDYDRFIDYLNKQMPEGVVIPGRYNTYVVKVAKKDSTEFFTIEKMAVNKTTALAAAQNEFGYEIRTNFTFTVVEEKS